MSSSAGQRVERRQNNRWPTPFSTSSFFLLRTESYRERQTRSTPFPLTMNRRGRRYVSPQPIKCHRERHVAFGRVRSGIRDTSKAMERYHLEDKARPRRHHWWIHHSARRRHDGPVRRSAPTLVNFQRVCRFVRVGVPLTMTSWAGLVWSGGIGWDGS